MRNIASSASLVLLALAIGNPADAATIWNGPDVIVDNPSFGGVQDVLTPNVIITRDIEAGIFNIAQEASYDKIGFTSPIDTKWAFLGLGGNSANPADITASNFAALNFNDWAPALGGPPSLQGNIVNRPGVVHLVSDDIYLDIEFTAWGGGASGGSFTYVRSSVPEPGSLALLGLGGLLATRRRRV